MVWTINSIHCVGYEDPLVSGHEMSRCIQTEGKRVNLHLELLGLKHQQEIKQLRCCEDQTQLLGPIRR